MREIVEVGLKNFQSHKNTVINFESGFNVVVGESDSGKTAIKRGIESVLYNKYVSEEFIREGEKSFSNYILFSEGLKITREKGGRGLNKYIINYPDGKELELNNFGAKVPQAVLDAHGMHLVELGKEIDSLNCAYQLSGPFFLQNTSGERASIIGSIAKTQIIDEAVSDTMSKHREQKKELKVLQITNKNIEKEMSIYVEWIDEARVLINKLENDYSELFKCMTSFENLKATMHALEQNEIHSAIQRNIIEMHNDIHIQESELLNIIDRFNKIKLLEVKYNRIKLDKDRKIKLELITNSYNNIENTAETIDKILSITNKYNCISNKIKLIENLITNKTSLENVISSYSHMEHVITDIEILEKDIIKCNELSRKIDSLNSLISRKQKGEKVIKTLQISLNESLNRYQNALEILGKCPVCYSIITEEQFSNIKENLA